MGGSTDTKIFSVEQHEQQSNLQFGADYLAMKKDEELKARE